MVDCSSWTVKLLDWTIETCIQGTTKWARAEDGRVEQLGVDVAGIGLQ